MILIFELTLWDVSGIIAIIAMIIFYFKASEFVWDILTIGAITGITAGLILLIKNASFEWNIFKKILIVTVWIAMIYQSGIFFGILLKKRIMKIRQQVVEATEEIANDYFKVIDK